VHVEKNVKLGEIMLVQKIKNVMQIVEEVVLQHGDVIQNVIQVKMKNY